MVVRADAATDELEAHAGRHKTTPLPRIIEKIRCEAVIM